MRRTYVKLFRPYLASGRSHWMGFTLALRPEVAYIGSTHLPPIRFQLFTFSTEKLFIRLFSFSNTFSDVENFSRFVVLRGKFFLVLLPFRPFVTDLAYNTRHVGSYDVYVHAYKRVRYTYFKGTTYMTYNYYKSCARYTLPVSIITRNCLKLYE